MERRKIDLVPINVKRTWGDREGHWGRWLWYVIVTKVIFSFRKSVFRDVRTDYNLDLRFLVNFNDNGGFVVGTHKHFSWQEGSARRLHKELINHNLYLFAWPFKVDYGWPL